MLMRCLPSQAAVSYVPSSRDRIEHYGHAADGRLLNVVTNRAETVVLTVVEQ
jgi:hypothetical protein